MDVGILCLESLDDVVLERPSILGVLPPADRYFSVGRWAAAVRARWHSQSGCDRDSPPIVLPHRTTPPRLPPVPRHLTPPPLPPSLPYPPPLYSPPPPPPAHHAL